MSRSRAIRELEAATASGLASSAMVFAALGDETRLRLISRLCDDGPMSIARLTSGFPITRQGITKHLRVMEDAGVVHSVRHGRESVWKLEQKRLAEAHRYLQTISREWDDTLARLKSFVEKS
ncbi:MAG TPA: metalloregulator ArsR/SmtB family transcription factor [Vicinamibacterales bacterium]|nr:metalloregulator ArsR/SmtB family transcription factor [Vicinamibacterales bacterium]